jgi:hypothetical protein
LISRLSNERFAYAILAADELVAVSNTIKFRYDDGKTFLNWKIGEDVDTGVWISVFLILAITINMFPVKVSLEQTPPQELSFTMVDIRSSESSSTSSVVLK